MLDDNQFVFSYRILIDRDCNKITAEDCNQVVTQHGKGMKFEFISDIALGPNEELVIVDSINKWIIVLDEKLNFLKVFGQGSGNGRLDYPFGIAVIDDIIAVSDCGSHQVKKYSLQGELLSLFGSYGEKNSQFNYPRGLAFADSKLLYIVDGENHRVQVFQQDNTFAFSFGSKGTDPGQFQRPVRIAIDPNTNVLVTDYDVNCIDIFSHSGHFIHKINCYKPAVVIVRPTGYLITCHGGIDNKIRVWSPTYQLVNQFGRKGCAQGEFDGICGMVFTAGGIIYIAERYNKRLQVIGCS